jgi:hypothetical protein
VKASSSPSGGMALLALAVRVVIVVIVALAGFASAHP